MHVDGASIAAVLSTESIDKVASLPPFLLTTPPLIRHGHHPLETTTPSTTTLSPATSVTDAAMHTTAATSLRVV